MGYKDILQDLTTLREQDIYSLSLFLLYKLSDINKYSIISELPYILERESMLKFCKYYGGRTIKVPTTEELMDTMKVLMLFQYYHIEKCEWVDSLVKSGFDKKDYRKAQTKLRTFIKTLREYNMFGEIDYE